jgi:hypothetical protein
VLLKHKPAEVYIGVESVNAILGRLLGYKKVIYWNLDYSPNRGWVWGLMDRLAIKLSDEVWTLSERGYKTVPIGCWFDEIKRLDDRERNIFGVVYIGLLEDKQGVGILMEEAEHSPYLDVTIIGTGKDENKYKAMGLRNVKFTGVISDEDAQEIMCKNWYGWDIYHPNNENHKIIPPTKPMTYVSCGLKLVSGDKVEVKHWKDIFENALNSNTHN